MYTKLLLYMCTYRFFNNKFNNKFLFISRKHKKKVFIMAGRVNL